MPNERDWADELADEIFYNAYFGYGDSAFECDTCARLIREYAQPRVEQVKGDEG